MKALAPYFEKRDFSVTSEPQGGKPSAAEALSFVIQKHAASRLHYDFRLELDGTLKSWAVPKGPSLDPNDKRMAVHVEDHPIDYGGFEGTIPAGQYGAGEVIVWDRGTWEPVGDARAGYRAGKLKFRLHGEKLHGGWTLVRMHGHANERQEPWLLIKERDDEARPAAGLQHRRGRAGERALRQDDRGPATRRRRRRRRPGEAGGEGEGRRAPPSRRAPGKPAAASDPQAAAGPPAGAKKAALPAELSPQLATLVSEPPAGDGWIYEIKFDGYRILARIDGDDVRLFTRRGNDWSERMPALVEAVRALGLGSAWLDGEIVVTGEHGAPDFNALQNAFDSARTGAIQLLPVRPALLRRPRPAQRAAARAARRSSPGLLERAPASERIRFSENFDADVERAAAERLPDAPRRHDRQARRFALCLQAQPHLDQAQVHPSPGVRDRRLDRPERLAHRARLAPARHPRRDAASSASPAAWAAASTRARSLRCARRSTASPARRRRSSRSRATCKGHWVRPTLVAEVSFGEWTPDGRIRHSVFHGLRDDKAARSITREQPVEAAEVTKKAAAKTAAGAKKTAAKTTAAKSSAAKSRRRRRRAATPRSRASASAIPTG